MLDSESVVTKCHNHLYVNMIKNYDIGKPTLMFINFAKASAILGRN